MCVCGALRTAAINWFCFQVFVYCSLSCSTAVLERFAIIGMCLGSDSNKIAIDFYEYAIPQEGFFHFSSPLHIVMSY